MNLGNFFYNNYKQALGIIKDDLPTLEEALQSLGITVKDLEEWEAEEVAYFGDLGKEPEWNIHTIAYVELLQDLQDAE